MRSSEAFLIFETSVSQPFFYIQAPVQYENEYDLQRGARTIPIGTLGFVMNTEALYIRVSQGWRSITVSNTIVKTQSKEMFLNIIVLTRFSL